MGILDVPFEYPFKHVTNLAVAFPNEETWIHDNRANRKEYESARSKHLDSVLPLLEAIWITSTGKVILTEIKNKPDFSVSIFPFEYDPDYAADVRAGGGAATKVMDPDGAAARKTEVEMKPPKGPGQPETWVQITYKRGKGSGAEIFYSASAITGAESTDESLLHELVHACRDLNGARAKIKMNGVGGYPNQEEFLAVVVTNMYRSKKKHRPLWDYRGGRIDAKSFLDSKTSPPPREVFGLLRALQPSLYRALADLGDVPFNPIRQLDIEVRSP